MSKIKFEDNKYPNRDFVRDAAESGEKAIYRMEKRLHKHQARSMAKTEQMINEQSEITARVIEKALQKAQQTQSARISRMFKQSERKNESLKAENERIIALYNETDSKYIELVERFNRLNNAYAAAVAENVDIKQSRTYRAALLQKKAAKMLHLIEPMKFMLLAKRVGVKEALRQLDK